MITGRRATDWLAGASSPRSDAEGRRGQDRRSNDRRAPRRRFDPLFAATLINQITPGEAAAPQPYAAAPRGVRAGLAFDFRA